MIDPENFDFDDYKKNNPENYRRLCEPFPNLEVANEAIGRFYDLVYKARQECGLKDVVLLIECNVRDEKGREHAVGASGHFGNSMLKLPIIAAAYGEERERFDNALGAAVARR